MKPGSSQNALKGFQRQAYIARFSKDEQMVSDFLDSMDRMNCKTSTGEPHIL